MVWTPKFSTRFIENPRKGAVGIVERDWPEVIAYYNGQPDTTPETQLLPFAKITNTRFVELFFSTRFEDFPILIISAGMSDAPEDDFSVNGVYTLPVEIWGVGSNAENLRSWMERCTTAVAMMFMTAPTRDYANGDSVLKIDVGKHKYRVMRANSARFYRDMTTFDLKVSLEER